MASRLASVEKLRAIVGTPADGSMRYPTIAKFLDEIEREIAERFIELPVGADGVPIHMGDTLQLGDTRGKVVALTYCPDNGKLPWEWQCDTGDWYNTAFAYHVKPRTIEDVLDEFLHTAADACEKTNCNLEEQIAKYAAELRGMMEADDE